MVHYKGWIETYVRMSLKKHLPVYHPQNSKQANNIAWFIPHKQRESNILHIPHLSCIYKLQHRKYRMWSYLIQAIPQSSAIQFSSKIQLKKTSLHIYITVGWDTRTSTVRDREKPEYECWLWIPGVADISGWLGEKRKSSTKAKHHFKANTNKPVVHLIMGI